MKKLVTFALIAFFGTALFAQGITTASAYFKTVSEYYGTLKDYEVEFEIKEDKKESAGKLSFLAPDLLRLDYSNPEDQVVVFNGSTLTIYLPDNDAVLQQDVSGGKNNAASMTTPQSLALMSRYYTVAYETGQEPEALDANNDEMVVKLILERKSSSEAFRYIKIAVNANTKLIRRIEAVTPKGESFTFDFYDYRLNSNITDQRFIYDAPSSANVYNNFLYSE